MWEASARILRDLSIEGLSPVTGAQGIDPRPWTSPGMLAAWKIGLGLDHRKTGESLEGYL
jgi:hypothetical protein